MASVVSGLFLFGISFLLAAHRLNGGGDPEVPKAPMCPQAIGASAGSSTSEMSARSLLGGRPIIQTDGAVAGPARPERADTAATPRPGEGCSPGVRRHVAKTP